MNLESDSILPSKNINKRKKVIIGILVLLVLITSVLIYNFICIKMIYNSLDISFKKIKEIEYGTANYSSLDLIEDSNGKITKYTKKVNTSKLGKQELAFEITKAGVSKTITVDIEIKDTTAPTILLKENEVTITQGETYDLNSNVEKVNDTVDGDLIYNGDEKAPRYTIASDFDSNKPGKYGVTINAVDSSGNTQEASYQITVNAKVVNKPIVYTNRPASIDTTNVVTTALSLIGTKYTPGGNSLETGFDCSGFVQYVYKAVGKDISRSSKTQIKDGDAIERKNMQAGDIIIWSTNSNDIPTHASVYIGDNTIVHAINSSKGVQKTSVNSWENCGGGHIVAIRRI